MASAEKARSTISTPKNTPVTGRVEGRRDAAPGAAGDEDAQAVLRRLDPLAKAGRDGTADLRDRPLAAYRAAGPDRQRGGQCLDETDLRADAAATGLDGDHHLGDAVPAGFPCPAVDHRPVEEAAGGGDDHVAREAEPRQVGAVHAAAGAELCVPGGEPGDEAD
jgi:hypothetical protein